MAQTALGDVIVELADLIDRHYVFPEAARRIASQLREHRFPVDDPETLAAAVKPFLRGHDGHLNLIYRTATSEADGPARTDFNDPEVLRRSNYGFRQVSILDDNVALLDISLMCDTEQPAILAAAVAATGLMANADAVIVDLRHVPGGWPSNHLLGHFLTAEPVHLLTMTKRGAAGTEHWTPRDNALGHRPNVPLFVLVDERTASAAEAFAYVAQSLGRASVIGTPTAGAANPGDFFPLGSHFIALIPTGAPIDPRTAANWEGTGVLPDTVTSSAEALGRATELARRAVADGVAS